MQNKALKLQFKKNKNPKIQSQKRRIKGLTINKLKLQTKQEEIVNRKINNNKTETKRQIVSHSFFRIKSFSYFSNKKIYHDKKNKKQYSSKQKNNLSSMNIKKIKLSNQTPLIRQLQLQRQRVNTRYSHTSLNVNRLKLKRSSSFNNLNFLYDQGYKVISYSLKLGYYMTIMVINMTKIEMIKKKAQYLEIPMDTNLSNYKIFHINSKNKYNSNRQNRLLITDKVAQQI